SLILYAHSHRVPHSLNADVNWRARLAVLAGIVKKQIDQLAGEYGMETNARIATRSIDNDVRGPRMLFAGLKGAGQPLPEVELFGIGRGGFVVGASKEQQ